MKIDDRYMELNVNAVCDKAVPSCSRIQETPKSSKLKRMYVLLFFEIPCSVLIQILTIKDAFYF